MKGKLKVAVKSFFASLALLSARLSLVLILFFVSLSLLIIIIRQIFYDKKYTMDERVFGYLSQFVTETNTSIMRVLSVAGSHYFLIPAWLLLLGFYYFIRCDKWMSIKIPVIALSNLGLMFALKFFFNRSRPLIPLLKDVPGLSFPSGHAFMSFIFYGFVIYLVNRDVQNRRTKWGIISILAFVILAIGLSRIYLRVHYASDVLAGYCFGMMSLLILLRLLRQIENGDAKIIPPYLNVTKVPNDLPETKHN
jgi:undecaprenyl-diphosphatase